MGETTKLGNVRREDDNGCQPIMDETLLRAVTESDGVRR